MEQRQIKFRVWDSTHKEMLDVKILSLENFEQPHVLATTQTKMTPEQKLLRAVFGTKPKHHLMQFTGLHDKNGDIRGGYFQRRNGW